MTPSRLFEMSYRISKKGGMVDTTGTPKHITSEDISNGALEICSFPSSSNTSGTLSIGLCYTAVPNKLRTSVSATEDDITYLYPDLDEDKDYYGIVVSQSRDYVSGTVEFNNLD